MNSTTKDKIMDLLSQVMEDIIRRRTIIEPFNVEEISDKNPFGFRLVPIEVWKGSKFERSFVTTLGQTIFEQLGRIVAEGTGAYAENHFKTKITINTWRKEKIDDILSSQRRSRSTPNWKREVDMIMSLQNQRYEDIEVLFDLYVRRGNGHEEYYSLKTVKPNLDQTEIAKRSMLQLIAGKPESEVYFALPYNPAGEGSLYRKAKHHMPYKLFQMDTDPCVLIGSKLWNKLGNDGNTYNELLSLFEEVGNKYSKVIRKEYFGFKE